MKKTVTVVAMMLVVIAFAKAQTFIPKAGVTLSTIQSDEDGGESKSRVGFTFGLGYNMRINDMFSIQPELNFIQKGAKAEVATTFSETSDGFTSTYSISGTANMALNYLELPVLLKFSFGDKPKFYLNAGPSVGLGVGGKYKGNATFTFTTTYQGVTESYSFSGKSSGKVKFGEQPEGYEGENVYMENQVELAAQFGGGVILHAFGEKIIVDLRYGLGLSNLSDEGDSKNRVWQLTVGIPLAGK